MARLPSIITFWWDFSRPGEMPIKLESNHPGLPDVIATFDGADAVARADNAVQRLSNGLDIHPRMKPERIMRRIYRAIQPKEGKS